MKEKLKCNKCNERGYIVDTPHSSHSCKCGWAVQQSLKKFEDISIEDLLEYGFKRIEEKEMLCKKHT